MKWLRRLFYLLVLFFLVAVLFGFGYYFFVTHDTVLQPEKLQLSNHHISLYDVNGVEFIADAQGTKRENLDFQSLPAHTKFAFISAEDKRFFSHKGFDVRRIVKSAYNNVKSHSFQQGASTISQQLIKNTHLSHEKTLQRKLKEFKLTRKLEKRYNKEEILAKYLSVIYFGHNCFGLRSAAAFYFDKSPEQLDLADSAILAGLVKSPNNYSPFQHPENCLARKRIVLACMQKNGYITKEQADIAMATPLPSPSPNKIKALGYASYVYQELSALAQEHNFTIAGEIKVHTYLDTLLQKFLEEKTAQYTESGKSFIVIDKQSLGVKAFSSSVGNITRLPGSLLKPLLVYAPAIEENLISPATPLLDEPTRYGEYTPGNYDGKYRGYVSARDCLAQSLNIPAVKTLECLGVEKGANYLQKMRLPIEKEDYSLALALGGMKQGFTLKDVTTAYATLANDGIFRNSNFIDHIDIHGRTVYQRETKDTRVFSAETAYLTTSMLQTAVQSGTAKKLRSLPFEIAAKTGTVGTQKGNTDAYAVSYTQKDVVGVWLGNADNTFIQTTGGGWPCNFQLQIHEYLCKSYQQRNEKIDNFHCPESVVKVELDKTAYAHMHTLALAENLTPVEYKFTELFNRNAIPQKTFHFFTSPKIPQPKIEYADGQVLITFENALPLPYKYKIQREEAGKKSGKTIYFDDAPSQFRDNEIIQDKKYIYTITPYYNQIKGETVVLPAITTKTQHLPPASDSQIIEKDWWQY